MPGPMSWGAALNSMPWASGAELKAGSAFVLFLSP